MIKRIYCNLLVFSLITIHLSDADSSLVDHRRRCVPTATVRGPCHVCICSAEGEFHCRTEPCKNTTRDDNKKECEPHFSYRENNLICTCSQIGYWRSIECRNEFIFIRPERVLILQSLRSRITCVPNSLFLIDCNICQCGLNGALESKSCTNRKCIMKHKADSCNIGDVLRTNDEFCSCSDVNVFIDRLCFKIVEKKVQIINRNKVSSLIQIGASWTQDLECIQFKEYILDCNRCICNETDFNCTNRICDIGSDLRTSKSKKEQKGFFSLLKIESDTADCEPGQKYRFKCNMCICSKQRNLTCTTMVCLEDFFSNSDEVEDNNLSAVEYSSDHEYAIPLI